LSAALEDPSVCAAMKADINHWFDAGGHVRAAAVVGDDELIEDIDTAIADSLDQDWRTRDGARAVVSMLSDYGWSVIRTPDEKGAAVAHSVYLSAVSGRMAFRDAYRRCLPVVRAAEALATKWTTHGQKVDGDDFYAAIHDVCEAAIKRNGEHEADDRALAAVSAAEQVVTQSPLGDGVNQTPSQQQEQGQ
jgi:hypothetical protein